MRSWLAEKRSLNGIILQDGDTCLNNAAVAGMYAYISFHDTFLPS